MRPDEDIVRSRCSRALEALSRWPFRKDGGAGRLEHPPEWPTPVGRRGAGFDLLITTDKNLRYQQNLENRRIGLIVLNEQQWPALRGHVTIVASAVDAALPSSFAEVDIP